MGKQWVDRDPGSIRLVPVVLQARAAATHFTLLCESKYMHVGTIEGVTTIRRRQH